MKIPLYTWSRRAAFTVVEVCIAVCIISVAVMALYMGISSGFQTIETARENLRATQIMVERLETIRLYTLDQVTNTTYVSDKPFTNWYNFDETNGFPYVGTISVSPFVTSTDANYATDLRQVTIELKWTSGGRQRTRSMHTLVARDGLQDYVY